MSRELRKQWIILALSLLLMAWSVYSLVYR